MTKISKIVRDIPRSGIRDFFEIVQTMDDVISLGIGEPDFMTPWHIRQAAIVSLQQGHTSYTSNLGMPRLRMTIAKYVKEHFKVSYDGMSEVLVTVGVSEGIDLALRALINPGDEVLYHEPCYVSYGPTIALAGGVAKPVVTRKENDFRLDAKDIEAAVTPRTKILMLNFPTNPTGTTLSLQDLEAIADVCRRHDLMVVTDEIYSELTYDNAEHVSIVSLPEMRDRTVLLHGVSKAYAMTGWRIGFACAPREITEAMMKIHQYSIMCAPTMGQEAAIEALEHGKESMLAMREEYEIRRNYISSVLNEIGLPCFCPRGAFYIFPDVSVTGLSGREFSLRLLKEKKVAVVPGEAFGASAGAHVRCSYASTMEKLKVALDRIVEFKAGC